MGFSFHVLPLEPTAMSVEALAARATGYLRAYLTELPIEGLIELAPPLLQEARSALDAQASHARITLGGVGAPAATWGLDGEPLELAFGVEPGAGGGRVRRFALEQAPEALRLARAAASERRRETELDRRLVHGLAYLVHRTRGQPPLAALAHGFVAAAIAEATNGLVVSADGAWEQAAWPCTGAELAATYLRPGEASSDEHRRQSEALVREVPAEFGPFDGKFLSRVCEEIVLGLVRDVNLVRGDTDRELAAFDRALGRLDTVRLLGAAAPVRERDLLIGSGAPEPRGRPASAFGQLHPNPEEYERWVAHLGEHLT